MHKKPFFNFLRIAILSVAMTSLLSSCFLFYEDSDDDDDEIAKQTSDWLILDYFDADNNLNDELFRDMLRQQYALSTIRGGNCPSVRILALWDGQNATGAAKDGNKRFHPNGALYELGAMDESTFRRLKSNSETRFVMSANTKELTSSVSWLSYEPDMGDVSTLTNYLKWANKYYSARNVVLMLSDHGAGTDYESFSGKQSARSLCFDDSDKSGSYLTATDVKNAIKDSGLNVNVIWQDCCLQGNAETAYLLRGCADYLVTSANTSYSNDHYAVISSLADSNSTPLSFAKAIVKAYADELKGDNMQMSNNSQSSYGTVLTQVAFNLNSAKQNALYSALDTLSSALIAEGESKCKTVYNNYLVQDGNDIANCKGMAYYGSYVYLNDIGYFCKNLIADSSLSENTRAQALRVMSALDGIIASSWLGTKEGETQYQYAKNVAGYSGALDGQGSFGLTIATQLNPYCESHGGDSSYPFYSHYSQLTGYSSNWGELMKIWH